MTMRSETQEILNKVEELTGTPVEIIEDPTGVQLATIARARNGVPFHLLRINASLGEPDYLIVYQCGFILRLYQLPPDERFEFTGSGRGQADVERWLRRAGQTTTLPETVRADLAQQLVDGLLTQLRSYPIGMRIDQWIHDEFPALDGLQRDAVARQQRDNLSVLQPETRKLAPKPVRDSNAAMNAAYAIFCDRIFGKAGYAIPYRSAGHEKRGRALLDLMEATPEDPAGDRALVDAWGEELGLADWYQWTPLQP